MMRSSAACVILGLFCGILRADDWVNKTVVAKRPGKIQIRAGNSVVAETTLLAFRVVGQNGGWIELSGYPQGWVQAADFVPLDKAVDYCTQVLGDKKTDAGPWFNLRGVAHYNLGELDRALADFDEAIRRDAGASIYFSNRGLVRMRMRNFDQAIVDFDQALRLEPKSALAFVSRGNAYREKSELARAIADYDAAATLDPKLSAAFYNRGMTHELAGAYDKALADLGQAARLDSKDADAWNGIAWLLAACPDAKLRDGKKALECAKFACELTQSKDANNLDTLAAAHAETGNFKDAVETAAKALALAADSDKKEIAARLELYKQGRPARIAKAGN